MGGRTDAKEEGREEGGERGREKGGEKRSFVNTEHFNSIELHYFQAPAESTKVPAQEEKG